MSHNKINNQLGINWCWVMFVSVHSILYRNVLLVSWNVNRVISQIFYRIVKLFILFILNVNPTLAQLLNYNFVMFYIEQQNI